MKSMREVADKANASKRNATIYDKTRSTRPPQPAVDVVACICHLLIRRGKRRWMTSHDISLSRAVSKIRQIDNPRFPRCGALSNTPAAN